MTRRYLVIPESGPTNVSGFAEWLTVSLPVAEAISA